MKNGWMSMALHHISNITALSWPNMWYEADSPLSGMQRSSTYVASIVARWFFPGSSWPSQSIQIWHIFPGLLRTVDAKRTMVSATTDMQMTKIGNNITWEMLHVVQVSSVIMNGSKHIFALLNRFHLLFNFYDNSRFSLTNLPYFLSFQI